MHDGFPFNVNHFRLNAGYSSPVIELIQASPFNRLKSGQTLNPVRDTREC